MVDGIYRISGIASNIKRLKTMFDTQTVPEPLYKEDWIQQDLHSVPSLIKLFFRELPEPMCSEKMLPLLKKGPDDSTFLQSTLLKILSNRFFAQCVIAIMVKDFKNPTIYNIIRWFAGPMGQMTRRPSI